MWAKVPATTANLGCAFDCAAIALNLHLTAHAAIRSEPGFELSYEGPQAASMPTDSSNLLLRAITRVSTREGTTPPGLTVKVNSQIPVGVGLGSSAAAIVAGLLIGAEVHGISLSDAEVIALATELEGHPDNVAAAYLGGFVVAATGDNPNVVLSRKADLPADLRFIVAVPDRQLPTELSRAALPQSYLREDAVHNLQRVALLVAEAFSGGFEFSPDLFDDRLHQPQRGVLIPGVADCLSLRHPDLLGIFLSGAGSSVMALARRSSREIAELLRRTFAAAGVNATTRELGADNLGARGQLREGGTGD
jgi:homoserine kinase